MSEKSSCETVPPSEPDLGETPSKTISTNNSSAQQPNNATKDVTSQDNEKELSIGRRNLSKWLGKTFRVVITDGRVLVGFFNCTDKDANVVLSMCAEYLEDGKDGRMLGNVMIPGKHIVSISVDMPKEEAIAVENPSTEKTEVR